MQAPVGDSGPGFTMNEYLMGEFDRNGSLLSYFDFSILTTIDKTSYFPFTDYR